MLKQPISVTLEPENITWLKARVGATGFRSVSELLNELVTQARKKGAVGPTTSVVGTIDVDAADPLLLGADQAVRAQFEASLGRPLRVKEDSPVYRGRESRGFPSDSRPRSRRSRG